jgi:hypothetical protein
MNRKSIAKSKVGCVRTTEDIWEKFEALADGWGLTFGEAFERIVTQAEHRNGRKSSDVDKAKR